MAYAWTEIITQGTDIEFGDLTEIRDVVDECNDGCYTHYVADDSNHDSGHDAAHYSTDDSSAYSTDDSSNDSSVEAAHDTSVDATHYASDDADHDTTHYTTHYSTHYGGYHTRYFSSQKAYDSTQSYGEGCKCASYIKLLEVLETLYLES